MTEDKKPWWESITVWGGLITVFASVIGTAFHLEIDTETQGAIVANVVGVAAGLGGLIAIYGRIRARQQLRAGKE